MSNQILSSTSTPQVMKSEPTILNITALRALQRDRIEAIVKFLNFTTWEQNQLLEDATHKLRGPLLDHFNHETLSWLRCQVVEALVIEDAEDDIQLEVRLKNKHIQVFKGTNLTWILVEALEWLQIKAFQVKTYEKPSIPSSDPYLSPRDIPMLDKVIKVDTNTDPEKTRIYMIKNTTNYAQNPKSEPLS